MGRLKDSRGTPRNPEGPQGPQMGAQKTHLRGTKGRGGCPRQTRALGPGPKAKNLDFPEKIKVSYAPAAHPQRPGSAPAAPRERQLGPSGRRTQQEPFASRSRENIETPKLFWTGTEAAVSLAQRRLCLLHRGSRLYGTETAVSVAQRELCLLHRDSYLCCTKTDCICCT